MTMTVFQPGNAGDTHTDVHQVLEFSSVYQHLHNIADVLEIKWSAQRIHARDQERQLVLAVLKNPERCTEYFPCVSHSTVWRTLWSEL